MSESRRLKANGRWQNFVVCCLLTVVCCLACCLSGITVAQDLPSPMRFDDASKAFSDQFGNPSSANKDSLLPTVVCGVIGVSLMLILAERYYRSRNTKNGYFSRNRLFRELCRSHEFTKKQQTILRSIAGELQLENPAVLFIEPKHLELALTESVVRFPQEPIRQIYHQLFSRMATSSDSTPEESAWFAWTKVIDNPEVDQLKKEPKKKDDKWDVSDSLADLPQTQQWNPSSWQDARRAVDHDANQKAKGFEISPASAPQEPVQTIREKPVYKPRYPETQDTLVHQSSGGQVSSGTSEQKTTFAKTPPSPGAQILSSMLYSVSDVTNELTYSSIRNHLTRSLSLSPQTLGEMKPRVPESTTTVSFDEIMVLTQKPFRQIDTQTQVEMKTEPKVAIKQIELKSIDLKPPKPFLNEE